MRRIDRRSCGQRLLLTRSTAARNKQIRRLGSIQFFPEESFSLNAVPAS